MSLVQCWNKVGNHPEGETVKLEDLPEDLQKVVAFHGHLCPGLLLGYRAANAAAAALQVGASEDEELLAIVENRSCSVDAFQVLLSTTFGKGNLIFRDYGKQVFTLGDRRSGRAIRVALRLGADALHRASREERMEFLLEAEATELFHLNLVELKLPEEAEIHPTLRCARCEEGVMSTRVTEAESRVYCLPCAVDLGLPLPAWFDSGGALVE
jgi:formylmethanofuran dehydrogenase subunit E